MKEVVKMRDTKKQMRDILRQDVQVSDVVNQRLCDTYKILERKQESSGKRKYYGKQKKNQGNFSKKQKIMLMKSFEIFKNMKTLVHL